MVHFYKTGTCFPSFCASTISSNYHITNAALGIAAENAVDGIPVAYFAQRVVLGEFKAWRSLNVFIFLTLVYQLFFSLRGRVVVVVICILGKGLQHFKLNVAQ